MTFRYRVRDPLGNTHAGTLEAPSADDAAQQLRRDGFTVQEIDEEADEPGLELFARRVGRGEIIYTTSQLAIMVETGVALSAALEGVAAQEENPTWKRILEEVRASVEEGQDFSAVLGRYPKLFDKTYISLVKASESTGTLGPMLDRIALYLRKELETRQKVRAAMAYPCVMMVLAVAVTVFLLTYVLPKFTPLFTRKGMQLPKPTLVMMALSDALIGYWYLWLAGLAAAVLGIVFGRRTEPGRKAWDWLKINLPLVGPMVRKVALSRSVRTLGTLLKSGVPMLDALQMSASVSGNWFYERHWRRVAEEVTGGATVHSALNGNPLFPRVLVQMIASGESTGKLDVVLERVSNHYDQEVESALKTVTSLLEPLLITVMGAVVGGIGLALLLPIFQLSRSSG
jgi:type IV pilus assembly protein PilC